MKCISQKFKHGVGDCCNYAHCIPSLINQGYQVEIETSPEKEALFLAAGATITTNAKDTQHYPNPMQGNNKLKQNLPPGASWEDTLATSLSLEAFLTPEQKQSLDSSLPQKFIALHTMGNTSPNAKNLPNETTLELYQALLPYPLLLLDWDNRVPKYADYRITHSLELGHISIPMAAYIIQKANLLIAIDSGMYHLARFTTTKVLGLWFQHSPWSYALPRANTINLALPKPGNWDNRKAFNIVECDMQADTIARNATSCIDTIKHF